MSSRVALITGANKGIGFETARQLGARGMTVLLGSRDTDRGAAAERALREEGLDAHAVPLEVTSDESVAALAAWIEEHHGRLDVLVNNAGISTSTGRRTGPSGTEVEDMRGVFETNVFAIVRMTNAMLPLLRASDAARIVNVSSEVGSITNVTDPASPLAKMPGSVPYPSSKAAVNMITAQYAKELRGEGILVNAANPGFTDTDFTNHHGIRPVEAGAEPSVYLATLPDDGPTGILYGHVWTTEGDGGYGRLPW